MLTKDHDTELGFFVSFLRWLAGWWTQTRLSMESGIHRTSLNRYEKGKRDPGPETLKVIAAAVGVPERQIGFLRWCLRLIQNALSTGRVPPTDESLPEEMRAAAADILERAMALARAECGLLQSATRPPGPMTQQERERAETLFTKLSSYPVPKQQFLIRGSRAYQDPFLCLFFCEKSEEAAPHDPDKALALAEQALYIAQHAQVTGFERRLEAWCTGFIGNVQRSIGSDLPGAGKTFDHAWRLWRQGEDSAGLLSEAHLLNLEASLRREQRQFSHARRLLDRALGLARPDEKGTLLLNKVCSFQEEGKHEQALQILEEADQHIDGRRQPRLRFGVRFNQASNLLLLRRTAEAVPIVAEARLLAEQLGNDIDLLRVLWLDASCASGLGQKEKALALLEQVRREFEARGFAFDFARASLDVALLYREEERFAKIVALAEEMLTIFKAQQVDQEAIAAVILFKEAAEKEQVTAGMVKRLAEYLCRVKREPGTRFGG